MPIDIVQTMSEPKLFQPWFRNAESFAAWRVFLKSMFAIPLDAAELETFQKCTGRATPPAEECDEAWLVVGRRGGKSLILALIAVYLATFRDYREHLVPGESAAILVLATDRRQARVIFRYARAMLKQVPALAPLVVREDGDTLELSNGIAIEITTAAFRSVRGYTVVGALLDEIAFWRNEELANPDAEILAALRPAMATIPHSKLLCASSPYARRGVLWSAHKNHFGKDGDPALVWQAGTTVMNPSVPQAVIDEAYERDPASAAAEYGAEFRTDIESFVQQEVLNSVTVAGRHELPPLRSVEYVAFCDPSGGSSDSMTLAIAHRDGELAVLDCVREIRAPFSPEAATREFAEVLGHYHLNRVTGDRYGGEWPSERFREHGIIYEPSELTKSEIYREIVAPLNSGKIELLDNQRLNTQLVSLERRTARGGKDSVDHPPGGHDDIANAVCGALVLVGGKRSAAWVWEKLGES